MSDARLRELQRRAKATGDIQDRVRWLRERLRSEPAGKCWMCDGKGDVQRQEHLAGQVDLPGWYLARCQACDGTGSALRAKLNLVAYCGDRASRIVTNWDFAESDHIEGVCPCPDCILDTDGRGVPSWLRQIETTWGDGVVKDIGSYYGAKSTSDLINVATNPVRVDIWEIAQAFVLWCLNGETT